MFEMIAAWDLAVLSWLHQYTVYGGSIASIWISESASVLAVVGVGGSVAVLLTHARRFWDLAGLVVSAGGAIAMAHALKPVVERARPMHEFAAYIEAGYSFPSAHAAAVIGLYGFLAWLVWRDCAERRWWHHAAVWVAGVLTVAVGFSRIYLGVHFPSDVLAGYALGGLFLYAGIAITRRRRDRNLC